MKISFGMHKSETVGASGLLETVEGTARTMRGENRKLVHEVIDFLA